MGPRVMRVACTCVLAALSVVLAEELDFKRIHLIEYNATSGNYLFRGNMPIVNKTFACACDVKCSLVSTRCAHY